MSFVSYPNIRDDYFLNETAYLKIYFESAQLFQYLLLYQLALEIGALHVKEREMASLFQNSHAVLSNHPYLHLQYYGLSYIRLLVVQTKLFYLVLVLERFPSFISLSSYIML